MFKKIEFIPFYPLLFIVYPAVALMGININEVEPVFLWRPLFVLLFIAVVLMAVFQLMWRDWHRSAILLAVFIFLFFSYGHLYIYLKKIEVSGFILGRHRQMIPIWVGLGALAVWWIARRFRDPRRFTPILNLISIFLLIYPTYQITSYVVSKQKTENATQAQVQSVGVTLPLGYAPDIYYIILDAYGRADVLDEMFHYDNTPFLETLKSHGFYVAQCSQSNYGQTMLSLTSSLNFNYLDTLTNSLSPDTDTRAPLRALGQHNKARKFLASQGYKIVSCATNCPVSEWEDADYFLSPPPQGMTDFELTLAQTTLWRAPMDMSNDPLEQRSSDWYRRRTLFTLQQLEETVPNIPGPKFVFAHLVIPHHPFVFDAKGGEVNAYVSDIKRVPPFDIYEKGYPDQVTYINSRIEKIVQIILDSSPNPPIIVIQGDHGPAPYDVIERRMKNLNAYYFPDGPDGLYSTITPVNTFRLIFNKYFKQNYPLLEDTSYFSEYDIPYNYTVVPNTCK